MQHKAIARLLLTLFAIIQAAATLAIDLGPTHATNAQWPGHARFHLVWQNLTTLLLSLLATGLIWSPAPDRDGGFYLASILAGIPMLSFLAALVFRRYYAGTLSDPNGIPPAKVAFLGKERHIDLNLAAVVAGFIALAMIEGIYSWQSS